MAVSVGSKPAFLRFFAIPNTAGRIESPAPRLLVLEARRQELTALYSFEYSALDRARGFVIQ